MQAVYYQVRTFATMLTELTGQDLPQWMADARLSADRASPGESRRLGFRYPMQPASLSP
jgi:hypothetical protein